MDLQTTTDTEQELRAALPASGLMARAQHPMLTGAVMAEPTSSAGAGLLLVKLLPAGVGAALMVAVDPPKNKRELFARLFAAFASSYLFGDTIFDLLHSLSLFSFLDHGVRAHAVAVDGVVGALGWFVLGGVSMMAKRFRTDPVATAKELKP